MTKKTAALEARATENQRPRDCHLKAQLSPTGESQSGFAPRGEDLNMWPREANLVTCLRYVEGQRIAYICT